MKNRILVALKENGEILDHEAKIVGKQSIQKITDLFLLPKSLLPTELANLNALSLEEKRKNLAELEVPVRLSKEARETLTAADIIIYGPGTQFSSLIPSYKTEGIAEAISSSPTQLKIFVMNLTQDEDIRGMSALEIVQQALRVFGDPQNRTGLITHVLFNQRDSKITNQLELGCSVEEAEKLTGCKWVELGFANPVRSSVHNGSKTIQHILNILDRVESGENRDLEIYIDLNQRSLAIEQLLAEFSEVDWKKGAENVTLSINTEVLPKVLLPGYLKITQSQSSTLFSEVAIFFPLDI